MWPTKNTKDKTLHPMSKGSAAGSQLKPRTERSVSGSPVQHRLWVSGLGRSLSSVLSRSVSLEPQPAVCFSLPVTHHPPFARMAWPGGWAGSEDHGQSHLPSNQPSQQAASVNNDLRHRKDTGLASPGPRLWKHLRTGGGAVLRA